jgi:hypothetical protein
MPHIVNDPTLAICPSFEAPEWDFLRQPMINAHQGPPPLTAEEATQRMKDAWTQENNIRVAAWNRQLELGQAERDERDRLEQEAEDARRVQREEEAADLRREAEKKKPKLNAFDPNRRVASWIEDRPCTYALNKIKNLQYVELDYFTRRGRREAATDAFRSINLDTFGFAQIDDSFGIRPLAAQNSSKNIRQDEDLSWGEMMDAKNTMLHFMAQSGAWPKAHAESLAAFFVGLELHPRRHQANGEKALLMYQSRVRQEWFIALDLDRGFNIENMEEELLRSLADIANDTIRQKDIEQV